MGYCERWSVFKIRKNEVQAIFNLRGYFWKYVLIQSLVCWVLKKSSNFESIFLEITFFSFVKFDGPYLSEFLSKRVECWTNGFVI